MRVALLYPPPWKIPAAGQAPDPVDGPPAGFQVGDLDPDFWQMPYGLMSLAAQALEHGHRVKLYNLSGYTWDKTAEVVAALDADLFGLSCWTANRRGVALVAREIKRCHPGAHVVVGGPHATPLAREMLQHYPDIDTVSIGESEAQLLELLARLERGASTRGIAGTAYRVEGRVELGPARAPIADLDTLASPHDYFDTHILMTSRGCPWQCTFCGAETSWGRGFRAASIGYVLDSLERAVSRAPVKMLQIKDDTFTTNKRRVMELCRGIRARGLRFLWSCDTRVDVLSDELLREMRLAGCERISLGVESGSPLILRAIGKKISVEQILASTELIKKYGMKTRYYMMLGNRGETTATFRESLAFLEAARPHQYIFSCLSVYPGTKDFADAEAAGWLDREVYFRESFQELKSPFDADAETTRLMNEWFAENKGVRELHRPSVEEYRAVLGRLGDHAPAHVDLGAALARAGELDSGELHLERALELGHPLPGLVHGLLAVVAFLRDDLELMQERFLTAARLDPQHPMLVENVQAVRAWYKDQGPERRLPLELDLRHDFRLLERTLQPTLPGPLPNDYAAWS